MNSLKLNFSIHRLIFEGDIEGLGNALTTLKKNGQLTEELTKQDNHGNTALHLACILGCTESIELLIPHGPSLRINNKYKCSPLHEAISFGNKTNLHLVLSSYIAESKLVYNKKTIESCLNGLPDCMFKLTWNFKSWIPLLANFLPADVCTIWKKSSKIKVNSSVTDMESYVKSFWKKNEQFSFIFDTSKDTIGAFLVNHDNHSYKDISDFDNDEIEAKELNVLMCSEIHSTRFILQNAYIEPQLSGMFHKVQKFKELDGFNCKCVKITNLEAETIMRTEHLSDEVKQRLDEYRSNFKKNMATKITDGNIETEITEFERSLEEMSELNGNNISIRINPDITFDQYQTESDCFAALKRDIKIQIFRKSMELEAALATDFYMRPLDLIHVLECIVTFKQFKRLKEFTELVSSEGFPLQIEVPIFPTIKAIVTLSDFDFNSSIDDSIFDIPKDYTNLTKA